jgi:hypothetical protein
MCAKKLYTAVFRFFLGMSACLATASALIAQTPEPIRLISFGDPPHFEDYLEWFDAESEDFSIFPGYVPAEDAQFMVFFMDSRSEGHLLPSALQPVFKNIVSNVEIYAFGFGKNVIGKDFTSNVLIFVRDETAEKMKSLDANLPDHQAEAVMSCIFALATSELIIDDSQGFKGRYRICKELTNG